MNIKKTNNSKLESTDFNNLPFGTVFSDHMLICRFKDGKWGDIEISPYGPIMMNPGSQVFHYGQSVFEGMKAFKNRKKELLIFRKHENFRRLNESAVRLSIPKIPENIFMRGLDALLSLDSDWCKAQDDYSLYIRPFIFASAEGVKASASNEYTFMIITSPTKKYYVGEMNVIIEEFYTRASRGGVGSAKAAGNYAASFLPTKNANIKGFQQLVWTDAIEHKYIEECGTMNIWFRIGEKLITPELSDSILAGITRNSVVTIAEDIGIVVEQRKILVSEIISAIKDGSLREAFGTGTAVTINPINSITFRDERFVLPLPDDAFSFNLRKKLQLIQRGVIEDIYGWTSKLSSQIVA